MVVFSRMNQGRLLLFGVTTLALGLSATALLTRLQNGGTASSFAIFKAAQNGQEAKPIEYKVGRVIRNSNEPHEVLIIISVDPKYFVRDEMVNLARQLKQDFAEWRILRVEIMDDPNIADNYIPAGDMYRLFNKAKRGLYVLNRNTKEEHIQFSTARGRPVDQVEIDLTEPIRD